MAVCDTCNAAGVGALLNTRTFRAALDKGLCPFRLGLDGDMGMAALRPGWGRDAPMWEGAVTAAVDCGIVSIRVDHRDVAEAPMSGFLADMQEGRIAIGS